MKKLLFGLATLPLLAGIAWAAEPLSDVQMDRITAGALPTITINCPGCIGSSSNTTSTTKNGVTATVGSTGSTGGSTGSTGGSTGSTGGSTGSTDGSTGSTDGSTGSTGGSSGSTGSSSGSTGGDGTPSILKVGLPRSLVSLITALTSVSVVVR